MKIAVIGSQCTGKTTFINDFIKRWSKYKICEIQRYSELIKEKGLSVNENGNEESQKSILNSLVDQAVYTPKEFCTLFDRSVLDNLVYTMYLNTQNKVSDAFVRETMVIVKETLSFYDILFFLPITKMSPVPFEEGTNRSNDSKYREAIDFIFKALYKQYCENDTSYFPFDHDMGCPAIIEIFGDPEQRIELAGMYVNEEGGPYTDEDTLIQIDGDDPEKPTLLEF